MKRRRTENPATKPTIERENEILRLRIIGLEQENKRLARQIDHLQGFEAINPLLYETQKAGKGENFSRAYLFLHTKLHQQEITHQQTLANVGATVDKALKASTAKKDATIRALEDTIRSFTDSQLLKKKELTIRTLALETNELQTENEALKQKIASLEARVEADWIDAILNTFEDTTANNEY